MGCQVLLYNIRRTLSAEDISSVFSRVDYSAVSHVADYISGKSGIRNLKAYLRSALYRAVGGAFPEARPGKARLLRAAVGQRQERGSERGCPPGTARDVRSAGKLRQGLRRAVLVIRRAGDSLSRQVMRGVAFPPSISDLSERANSMRAERPRPAVSLIIAHSVFSIGVSRKCGSSGETAVNPAPGAENLTARRERYN